MIEARGSSPQGGDEQDCILRNRHCPYADAAITSLLSARLIQADSGSDTTQFSH
jgi:hypothetical protein